MYVVFGEHQVGEQGSASFVLFAVVSPRLGCAARYTCRHRADANSSDAKNIPYASDDIRVRGTHGMGAETQKKIDPDATRTHNLWWFEFSEPKTNALPLGHRARSLTNGLCIGYQIVQRAL